MDPKNILLVGADELPKYYSGDDLTGVRQSYLEGLRASWALGIALFGVAFLFAFLPKGGGKLARDDGETNKETAEGHVDVLMMAA